MPPASSTIPIRATSLRLVMLMVSPSIRIAASPLDCHLGAADTVKTDGSRLPLPLLALPAGMLADHFDRKRLLLACDAARAAALAALTIAVFAGHVAYGVVVAVAFIDGALLAVSFVAEHMQARVHAAAGTLSQSLGWAGPLVIGVVLEQLSSDACILLLCGWSPLAALDALLPPSMRSRS